jgi:hypothetical protein
MILALLLRLHGSCFNLQKPEVIQLPLPSASAQAQAREYTHASDFSASIAVLKDEFNGNIKQVAHLLFGQTT